MSKKLIAVVAAPLVLLGLAFGGAWVYANVVAGDAPGELSLGPGTPAPAATGPVEVDGTWTVTPESTVGYRVDEVLFGNDVTAVGRTNKVTGSLTVAGTRVTEASFTVDMASVTSDRERRDAQYRTRIMDTGRYPTSTFELTEPIDLGTVPGEGQTVRATATGRLTLRGTTKVVSFQVEAQRSGNRLSVDGSIPLVFAEWGIPDASFGPARVEPRGELEFLLVLAK